MCHCTYRSSTFQVPFQLILKATAYFICSPTYARQQYFPFQMQRPHTDCLQNRLPRTPQNPPMIWRFYRYSSSNLTILVKSTITGSSSSFAKHHRIQLSLHQLGSVRLALAKPRPSVRTRNQLLNTAPNITHCHLPGAPLFCSGRPPKT